MAAGASLGAVAGPIWGSGRGADRGDRRTLVRSCRACIRRQDGRRGSQFGGDRVRCFLEGGVRGGEFRLGDRCRGGERLLNHPAELLVRHGAIPDGPGARGCFARGNELRQRHQSDRPMCWEPGRSSLQFGVHGGLLRWLSGALPEHSASDCGFRLGNGRNDHGLRLCQFEIRGDRSGELPVDLHASGSDHGCRLGDVGKFGTEFAHGFIVDRGGDSGLALAGGRVGGGVRVSVAKGFYVSNN